MKALAYIVLLIIAFLLVRQVLTNQPRLISTHRESDPIQAMAQTAASFPKNTFHDSTGNRYPITNVSYDVKKTDSLVNPMVGYINFTEAGIVDMNFQFVFQWQNERWHFSRMICRDNDKDFTDLPGGREILRGSPMREFLAQYQ